MHQQPITKILTHIFRLFLRLTSIHRERKDLDHMYLGKTEPGKLLEVGCGDGSRLSRLATLGWSVEGQEVDPVSATIAAKTGIKIHLGPLGTLSLPDASYDAIVMNHVIEHVHEPVKLLTECRRLLKPGGILIAVTPNIQSFGHRIFKSHWRGLEPPRHILLYCQGCLRRIAHKAGFLNPQTWTTAAKTSHFALESLQSIYKENNLKPLVNAVCYFTATLFLLLAWSIQILDKNTGEECILILKK